MISLRIVPAAILATLAVLSGPAAVPAQLTIQQPVFGVTSTATTVSVPDRGRAHLSSINSAGESRTSFGPFRPGTNTGLFREGSSTSVSVTIHDFDEMDRYLLGQPTSGTAMRSGPRVDDPYQQLLARSQRRGTSTADTMGFAARRGVTPAAPETEIAGPAGSTAAARGDHFFGLGKQAEDRGSESVARLHYRLAAKHGHAEATARLALLEQQPLRRVAGDAGR